MLITITKEFEEEARWYAHASREYLSKRRNFHGGTLEDAEEKMFMGKLGEKAFKQFLIDNCIPYLEDKTSEKVADDYDFLVNGYLVDAKARTEDYQTRTLEIKEQMEKKPKDIYISCRTYRTQPYTVKLIGWAYKEDFLRVNRVEILKNGNTENYVLFDYELRPIIGLINVFFGRGKAIHS